MDGTIYRHDNMPHSRWASVATFPQHYNDGGADHVGESQLSVHPETALREFLDFVRRRIGSWIWAQAPARLQRVESA